MRIQKSKSTEVKPKNVKLSNFDEASNMPLPQITAENSQVTQTATCNCTE